MHSIHKSKDTKNKQEFPAKIIPELAPGCINGHIRGMSANLARLVCHITGLIL